MSTPAKPQDEPRVLVRHADGVCRITLNRPGQHNTMTGEMLRELAQAFDDLSTRKDAFAVVLTGAGTKTFCAGGQLVAGSEETPFELNPGQFDNPVALLFRAMERCAYPIIGRINGGAFGGGVGLVCACDVAVGVDTASFGTTEARVGVFPLMILPLLMRVIPRRHLFEMCYFAAKFSAAKAVEIGLLNTVVAPAQLDAEIARLLDGLRRVSPTSLRIGRRAINAVTDISLSDALNLTQALLPLLAQSDDAKEGFAAFAQRREPRWKR